MIKFMKTVSEQMGVELFVLAGFRNEEGEAMKIRYDTVIILYRHFFNDTYKI